MKPNEDPYLGRKNKYDEPEIYREQQIVGMQRICSGIGLEDQTDVPFHVFMPLFSLITSEREDNMLLITNILMCKGNTTTKKTL